MQPVFSGLDVLDLEVAAVGDDVDRFDPEECRAPARRSASSRPMSTTWLVTACSPIILIFASTANCSL